MQREEITVRCDYGLHARPAAAFVKLARRYRAELVLEKNGERVNAKSIMGVMMLAVARGETVFLEADGPDAGEALAELKRFLENGAPEP